MEKWLKKHVLHFILGGFLFVIYILGFLCGYFVKPTKTETVVYEVCTPTYTTTETVTERTTS